MSQNLIRPNAQINNIETYNDSLAIGSKLELSSTSIETDIQAILSIINKIKDSDYNGNWYDDIPTVNSKQRGVLQLNTDLDNVETIINALEDKYIQSGSFNTSNGVLTLTLNDLSTIQINLDGKYQNELTFGIENNNSVIISSESIVSGEFAKFTSTGLESVSTTELKNELEISLDDVSETTNKKIFTLEEKNKLASIQENAEVNVNADWNAITGASEILNKPSDLTNLTVHSVTELSDMINAGSGSIITNTERIKLNNIEENADLTDSVNVDLAGAVMNTDTSTVSMSFVVDEDNMSSNSESKIPTQQSVKAYVDAEINSALSSEMTYKGSYNASTNTPDLDTSPSGIKVGDMYTVIVAGTFYTEDLSVGDVLIAEVDNSSSLSDWTIVSKSLEAASIKTLYESNSNTNAFTDSEKTKLSGISSGAEVNVNSDWNAVSGDAQILNKPTTITNEEQTKLGYISVTQAVDLDQMEADIANFEDKYLTTASFSTSSGIVTLTLNDTSTITVNLDGRYLTTITSIDADVVTVSNLEVDNFKSSAIVTETEGILSNDNDTTIPTSAAVKDYVDNTVIPDTNTYVTSASFNTSDGVLTLTLNDASTVTVDLDGRFLQNIVEDNTPQLGADLDLNSNDITGTGNIDITGEITATTFIGDMRGATIFQAKAGEALTKGDPVYISGDDISGNKPIVSIADSDNASKMPCFGLAAETVKINANVNVVTFGTLSGLATASFNQGDILYISTTGTLTATKPTGESSLIQNIGKVMRSHATVGSIKVGGAGRTNDVPNLNSGNVFIGNASNQAETRGLTLDDVAETANNKHLTAMDLQKLIGIEDYATQDQTKAEIEAMNINADQVDGLEASQFLRSDTGDNIDVGRGNVSIEDNTADRGGDTGAGITFRTTSNPSNGTQASGTVGSIFGVRASNSASKLWVGMTETTTGDNDLVTNDATFNGNISVTGTVDGRNVSNDGQKLDNITVTQAVDLDQMEQDVAANNIKVSNWFHTGDVIGGTTLSITDEAVTNTKLAHMGTGTVKGRTSAGTGDPEDLAIDTTLKTALNLSKSDVGLANVPNVDATDASNIANGNVSNTEFQYLDGVTSNIQTQINNISGGGGGGIASVQDDTSPTLGGDLDANSKKIENTDLLNFDTTPTATLTNTADMIYNSSSDTLELKNSVGEIKIGQTDEVYVTNGTGGSIPAYQPVYKTTASFGNIAVTYPFIANGTTDPVHLIGITSEMINKFGSGKAVRLGVLDGMNTSSFSVGDTLYIKSSLSTMPFTATKPTGTNQALSIGIVLTSATSGKIWVNVNNIDTNSTGSGDANVQSDWNETDTNSDAFIQNKPTTITSAEQTKLGHISVTQAVNLDQMETDITANNAKVSITSVEQTKLGHISVSQAVDLDTMESDIATNNAKDTNATHTGEVTGATSLTITDEAVTNAKLSHIATGTVKGRTSAGTGDPEDLDISTTLKTALSLTKSDVGLANVPNVDTTDASNISTGTLAEARLPNGISATRIGIGLVDASEFDRLNGVTSNIQNQINGKKDDFTENKAFNKNFGTAVDTVAQGNDSRIINAFQTNTGGTVTGNVIATGEMYRDGTKQISSRYAYTMTSNTATALYLDFSNSTIHDTNYFSWSQPAQSSSTGLKVLATGTYQIYYKVNCKSNSYRNRVTFRGDLNINNNQENEGISFCYVREDRFGNFGTLSASMFLRLNQNDAIKIKVTCAKAGTNFSSNFSGLQLEGSWITCQYIGA